MALTRVQATGKVQAVASSVSMTLPAPPTVGNAVVVLVHSWIAAAFPAGGCVDNRGNPYTLAVTTSGNPTTSGIYYCPKVTTASAPFTITVTGPGGYYIAAAVEVGGLSTAGLALAATAQAIGSSTTIATGPTSALTAAEVFLAAIGSPNANQASITVESVSPAWTQEYEELNQSAFVAGEGDTRIRTGVSGTQSCTWTIASTAPWSAALAVFGDATPPPPAALTGELDSRILTTATGTLNATWTGTASGNWTAGLVALKKT